MAGGAVSQNGHFCEGSEVTGVPPESTPELEGKDRCLYASSFFIKMV